jgi:hypothetical protein
MAVTTSPTEMSFSLRVFHLAKFEPGRHDRRAAIKQIASRPKGF